MMNLEYLTEKVLDRDVITKEEALFLYSRPLEPLCKSADKIRRYFCSEQFDLCTIINAKSGGCPENCRFCTQSSHSRTQAECYPLLSAERIVAQAKKNQEQGVLRYSIVTSGKCLSDREIDQLCEAIRQIKKEVGISVCVSFSLLTEEQFRRLKEAGVTRVHNNLETSRRNFPHICTTHTFDDKIRAIRHAQAAGLLVCSGVIMGLGETAEDRIDMAVSLRRLGIKSVPVNLLNPIPGTPMEKQKPLDNEELRRIVAVYRFLLPDASIRLAGGRGLLADQGKSYVTGLILKKFNESGKSAAYYKAAMSGNHRNPDGTILPGDALDVKARSGISQPIEEMCPYVYETAVSPHLASRLEKNPIQWDEILRGFDRLCQQYEYITAEGSGGILCPLRFDREKIMLEDFIKARNFHCLLVADAGFGTINSVVLTAEYMKARSLCIKGIIFNHFEEGNVLHEDNRYLCEKLTGLKVLACVKNGEEHLPLSFEELEPLYE
uniref:Multifunctional fusion protein n=1 Tax=Eubacterium plexicaudatum ASF492 TaxID=1235802 RepID=N2AGQ6_9FIRM